MLKPYWKDFSGDKENFICPHCKKAMYPPKPLVEERVRCPYCHKQIDLSGVPSETVIIDGDAHIRGKALITGYDKEHEKTIPDRWGRVLSEDKYGVGSYKPMVGSGSGKG